MECAGRRDSGPLARFFHSGHWVACPLAAMRRVASVLRRVGGVARYAGLCLLSRGAAARRQGNRSVRSQIGGNRAYADKHEVRGFSILTSR